MRFLQRLRARRLAAEINTRIDAALAFSRQDSAALALARNPFITCFDATCAVCQLRRERNRD